MKTRSHDAAAPATARTLVAWTLALLIAGCGGGAALLVPFFTFGFSASTLGGVNHAISVNLNPNEPTTATGNFESGSTLSFDAETFDLTGSYAGCSLALRLVPRAPATTVPAPLSENYGGAFAGPDTIQLTPSSGGQPALTLVRSGGQKDTRPQTC